MNMTAFAVALVVLIVVIVYFDIKGNKPKEKVEDVSTVRIADIRMPFGSMVVFMVKWAIASIPAIIILYVLFVLFGSILSGVVAGITG